MKTMVKIAPLALTALLLVGCGEEVNKADRVSAPRVLAKPALIDSAPPWAAWLGPPSYGQQIIDQPSGGQISLVYIKGSDLTRVKFGKAPRQGITVSTQRSENAVELTKVLKPKRRINTAIGKALVTPDGRQAYIVSGNRVVVVQVPSPAAMRTNLDKLIWVSDSQNLNYNEADPRQTLRR
jgi:hypothetical protein